MVIKKDRCHKCNVEIDDGEYYCNSCLLEFEISDNLDGRV